MANKPKKRSIIVNYDIIERTKKLNNEQFGVLMRALISYDATNIVPPLDASIEPYFNVIKVDIDENKALYEKKCVENKAKLDRYWNDIKSGVKTRKKDNDTNVYNGIQMYTNDTDKIISSFNEESSFNNSSFLKENLPIGNDAVSLSLTDTPKFNKSEYILTLFEKIWAIYPRKVGKEQAKKTWNKKLITLKTQEDILSKAQRISKLLQKHIKAWAEETGKNGNKGRPKQYLPHFSTWLNDEIPDKEK